MPNLHQQTKSVYQYYVEKHLPQTHLKKPIDPNINISAPYKENNACYELEFANDITIENPLNDYVTQWLTNIKFLEGIPINYLIANENLLPLESLRIIYLDNNWVNALIDGSKSIGRFNNSDHSMDESIKKIQSAELNKNFYANRSKKLGKTLKKPESYTQNSQTIGGLLLRSAAVKQFPNMELEVYKNVGNTNNTAYKKLDLLHFSHLRNDILLAIFPDKIDKVIFKKPQEILHFGLEKDPTSHKLIKKIKSAEGTYTEEKINAEDFLDASSRRLNISQLAKNKKWHNNISNAEFSMQMIQGTGNVFSFILHNKT